MARSIKKGPYVAAHLEDKVIAINDGKNKKGVIKTWSRRSTITPDLMNGAVKLSTLSFNCPVWV